MALSAAQGGFKVWKITPIEQLSAVLKRAAQLLRERADDISAITTQEQGKLRTDAKGEVLFTASLFDFYADEASCLCGLQLVRSGGFRSSVNYFPVGPVALLHLGTSRFTTQHASLALRLLLGVQ